VATSLTVRQLAAICCRNPEPPWHLKDLPKLYKRKTVSVKALLKEVGSAKTIFWLRVRDPSIYLGKSFNAWPDAIASSTPSRATLVAFDALLKSVGAYVVCYSSDWKTVGISGTCASLAQLHVFQYTDDPKKNTKSVTPIVQPLDLESGLDKFAKAAMAAGTFAISVGGPIPEPAWPLVVIGGAFAIGVGVGIEITLGIFDVQTPPSNTLLTPIPPPGLNSGGPPTQFGTPPAGVDAGNPPTAPLDAGSLPSSPAPEGTGGKEGPVKDGKDDKDGKELKDGKDKEGKDDGKEGKDGKDGKEFKDGKEGKDGKDGKEFKDGKEGKEGKETKDGKELSDGTPKEKESKDSTDFGGAMAPDFEALHAMSADRAELLPRVLHISSKPERLLSRHPII
jgi:hypothetical protein